MTPHRVSKRAIRGVGVCHDMQPTAEREKFAQNLRQADLTLGPRGDNRRELTTAVVDHGSVCDPRRNQPDSCRGIQQFGSERALDEIADFTGSLATGSRDDPFHENASASSKVAQVPWLERPTPVALGYAITEPTSIGCPIKSRT